jgi:hypothetical protein
MSNERKGRAYVSPYLLQPIRTLAEVSAELAKKGADAVRAPLEKDAEQSAQPPNDNNRAV